MTDTPPAKPPAEANLAAQPGGHDAIRARSEDRLQRAGFADRIGRQIALAPAGSSMVLAVTGPWGSGKTSVLNMVTEALCEAEAVTVLEFNPWLFSSPQELVGRFFAELSAELIGTEEKRLKMVGEALQRYGARLAPIRFVPVIGGIGDAITSGAQSIGKSLVDATDESAKSLRRQHQDLAQLLRDLPGRVVIILDDIDRLLHGDEVREVMRLVRLTSDLPNITYLLAFDRVKVEAALTAIDSRGDVVQSGRGYLEKIVQEVYDLPAIRSSDLEALLLDGIEGVAEAHPQGPLDVHVLLNIFHRCIKPLFTTVRDVRRYLSILPVALEHCGDEVALSDVLALEALRLLVPESYALLPVSADVLTRVDSGGMGINPATGQAVFDAFINASLSRAEVVRAMSAELFPASRRYNTDRMNFGGDFLRTWRKDRRVAHRDVLQFYLSRSLSEGVLPAALIELAFRSLANEDALTAIVNALSPDELVSLLGRLEDYEDDFPPEAVEPACVVLMNQHHRLGREKTGLFSGSPSMALCRVVIRLLRRIADEARQTEIVERVLTRVDTLSAKYALVDWVGHRDGVGIKLVPAEVAEAWLAELVQVVLSTDTARLATERDAVVLLDACLTQDEANRPAVMATIDSDDVLLSVLRGAMRSSHQWNMGEVVTTRTVSMLWPALERLFSKETLIRRLTQLTDLVAGADSDAHDAETRTALNLAAEWLAEAAQPPSGN